MSVCKTAISYEAGHEYIDLGLSVKWATCNTGAESPDGYGYRYDRVNIKWSGRWRIPSAEDFRELIENCSFEWQEQDDVRGLLFVSMKPGFEGRSIFLRASGLYDIDEGGPYEYGLYWVANLSSEEARILFFEKGLSGKGEVSIVPHRRDLWASIRPVF